MGKRIIVMTWALALLAAPSPALAGYYFDIDYQIRNYPADGAADVPLNPILVHGGFVQYLGVRDQGQWKMGPYPADIKLKDDQGAEVALEALDQLCEHDSWVVGFTPASDLKPKTRYQLWDLPGNKVLAAFTTGTARDSTGPAFDPDADDEDEGLHVTFKGSDDIALAITSAEIDMGATCIVRSPTGGEVDMRGAEGVLGYSLEWRDEHKLTVVDRAGNTRTVTVPLNDSGCSVAAGGGEPGGPLLLCLVALGFLIRRRLRR